MIVNLTTRERTSAKKGVYVQFILLYGEGKRKRLQKTIKNCWYSVNASEAEKDRIARQADRVLKQERAKAVATAYNFKEVSKPKELLVDYFQKFIDRKAEHITDVGHYTNALDRLKEYLNKINQSWLPIDAVDEVFCVNFFNFLLNEPAKRTRSASGKRSARVCNAYYARFKAVMTNALQNGKVTSNPSVNIHNAKTEPTKPAPLLNSEHIKALYNTPFPTANIDHRRAFLFICFTGLRPVDIKKLTWDNIVQAKDGTWRLNLVQSKTKHPLNVALHPLAFEQLGSPKAGKIFKLKSGVKDLKLWAYHADLPVDIVERFSMYSGRHTFASIHWEAFKDIVMLSKSLGHANASITHKYLAGLQLQQDNANLELNFF